MIPDCSRIGEQPVAAIQKQNSHLPCSKDSFLVYHEAKLSARREELAAVDGDFDSILAGLKSECNLFSDLDELKEQCPLVGRSGEETAPLADDTGGEGEAEGEGEGEGFG
ncbi:hypothetical protein F2Q68_00015270 [Brassica cretica]|uniref:Uncharacterized protein n=1 Tax=Brassica cretica TaxID=69181 RepID=A0A8S9HJU2_BRACR|nr:hypothetical protein F2Q68_00015270 [Brassica cretica]